MTSPHDPAEPTHDRPSLFRDQVREAQAGSRDREEQLQLPRWPHLVAPLLVLLFGVAAIVGVVWIRARFGG